MLEEAIKNARDAALRFSKNSDTKLGSIHTANQGVFSITGTNNDKTYGHEKYCDKKVRVVSTVTFGLQN
jgi:hypothetical protein